MVTQEENFHHNLQHILDMPEGEHQAQLRDLGTKIGLSRQFHMEECDSK